MNLISAERCENCKVRYRQRGKKWCKRCIERYYRKQKLSLREAEIETLNLVEALYANATLTQLEESVREILLTRKADQDLFLYGPPGVGKTHAMAALIRYYVFEGYECERICFSDFCCQVRSTMNPASKTTEWEMINPLKEVDMLFIDDLGLRSTPESPWVYDTLFGIVNKRQERLLPTFVSSNKDLDRLRQSFDDRITSRLRTALIIEVKGIDRRLSVQGAKHGKDTSD